MGPVRAVLSSEASSRRFPCTSPILPLPRFHQSRDGLSSITGLLLTPFYPGPAHHPSPLTADSLASFLPLPIHPLLILGSQGDPSQIENCPSQPPFQTGSGPPKPSIHLWPDTQGPLNPAGLISHSLPRPLKAAMSSQSPGHVLCVVPAHGSSLWPPTPLPHGPGHAPSRHLKCLLRGKILRMSPPSVQLLWLPQSPAKSGLSGSTTLSDSPEGLTLGATLWRQRLFSLDPLRPGLRATALGEPSETAILSSTILP